MKLFFIIGIFLGSALTASAQGIPYGPWDCVNCMSSGSTGSGNNTSGRPVNQTQPSTGGAQSTYSLTRERLTPQTAPYAGYATREQINEERAAGINHPIATRGFISSLIAPTGRTAENIRIQEKNCRGIWLSWANHCVGRTINWFY